jgi:molecular chaperone GrpE
VSRQPVTDPLETNPDAKGDQSGVDSPTALEAITAERDRLAAENAELQDRFLRFQAEFQNFRKRVDKDRLEFSEYASLEAVRTLLPIIDDFERALQTETTDRTYAQGLELIRQRLFDTLKKLGLEPIVAQGEPFDPHVHHAVEMVETEDAPDHTVLGEFQRGYNFKGRLLRPAMVKVAVEPKRD